MSNGSDFDFGGEPFGFGQSPFPFGFDPRSLFPINGGGGGPGPPPPGGDTSTPGLPEQPSAGVFAGAGGFVRDLPADVKRVTAADRAAVAARAVSRRLPGIVGAIAIGGTILIDVVFDVLETNRRRKLDELERELEVVRRRRQAAQRARERGFDPGDFPIEVPLPTEVPQPPLPTPAPAPRRVRPAPRVVPEVQPVPLPPIPRRPVRIPEPQPRQPDEIPSRPSQPDFPSEVRPERPGRRALPRVPDVGDEPDAADAELEEIQVTIPRRQEEPPTVRLPGRAPARGRIRIPSRARPRVPGALSPLLALGLSVGTTGLTAFQAPPVVSAPPAPAPVPQLPGARPPTGSRAGRQKCEEVKRRRRRKGKCREGFFRELPGSTQFVTWREVDCAKLAIKQLRSDPAGTARRVLPSGAKRVPLPSI